MDIDIVCDASSIPAVVTIKQNMILRTKEIIDFKIDSSKIMKDEFHPIASFLKIDFKNNYCVITKNGLHDFIVKSVPCESNISDGSILINEDKLINIAENTMADIIEIKIKGEKILFKSGNNKGEINTGDVSLFHSNDEPTAGWTPIFAQTLVALESAVNFIEMENDKGTSMPQCIHVFIKDKSMIGCDGNISFYKELYDPAPQLILRRDIIMAIKDMPGASYSFNSSYDFFKSENIIFGFSKTECPFFDMSQFGRIEQPENLSFILNKDELIKFNNFCINSSKSKLVTSYFDCKSSNELRLFYTDPDTGVYNYDTTINVINGSGSFAYRPQHMNRLLRSIPATICYFYKGKNKYYITDETKSFVALIMGVVKT